MLSLEALFQEWANHPLGKNRAPGGRRSLGGFRYQLYLSLERFFDRVLEGDNAVQFVFDGLSDLAEARSDLVYLTQAKSTLTPTTLKSAISEALDVERFLLERHPDLRESFRYQITARRFLGHPKLPSDLSPEEAQVLPSEMQLWEQMKSRWLPTRIQGSPEIDLAIRLWPHAKNSFKLVHTCLGIVVDGLEVGSISSDISRKLLDLWDSVRSTNLSAIHLLGVEDFETSAEPSQHIAHGVRPALVDLRAGCFMERPIWVEQVLRTVRSAWEATLNDHAPSPLPVVWISGPSGAGKSVLLLQSAKELIFRGEAEAVHHLAEFADHLPDALRFCAEAGRKLLITLDDAFAPDNRDPAIWRRVAELAVNSRWSPVPLILTCGPLEQRKAFEREWQRHRGLRLFFVDLEPLNDEERVKFHDWYQERTKSEVPLLKEPIFVAATWAYELARRTSLSPEAFARRFDDRLLELGLQGVARAAMALNSYGFKAPEALFAGFEISLAQLRSEQIYRLAGPSGGESQAGIFFHARIARLLYDSLVEEQETLLRARDLALGFEAMLVTPEAAARFLEWLSSPRSEARLPLVLHREVLCVLWPAFNRNLQSEAIIPLLKKWHDLALRREVNLLGLGAVAGIRQRWEDTPQEAPSWGILAQIVCADSTIEERGELLSIIES
jgi:hypothetical protein